MKVKNILSITEARKRIFQIINEVQKPDNHYVLTEHGKPKAIIMSVAEFESLEETLEVMKIFPNLEKEIKELEEDYKSGNYKNYPTLEEAFSKKRLVIADSSRKKYGLSDKTKVRRGKRTK